MRALKFLACAGLFAVLAAGCGGSSGEKVAIEATPAALRKSAEATLSKGAAKLDLTMELTAADQPVTLHGTGVIDPPHKRFQLDLDAKELFGKLLEGKTNVPPDVASAFDQPLTEILDGTVMYMRFPLFAKSSGKEWLKFDLAAVNSSFSDILGSGGTGSLGTDPTAFLQFLEGAGKVTKVGEEDVRGVKTTHFSGSYSMKDALASLPDDRRAKVEKTFEGLGLSSAAEDVPIPFDAWLGDDGLVRRVQTSIDPSTFTSRSATPVGKISVTMELFDFGTPVDITIPSDDEVRDVSGAVASSISASSSLAGN